MGQELYYFMCVFAQINNDSVHVACRDYLFKCVDNSESLAADAYGQRHLTIPLRDDGGVAIVVIDISIGDLRELSKQESREVMKMMKLLQTAYKEINQQTRQTDTNGKQENESDIKQKH